MTFCGMKAIVNFKSSSESCYFLYKFGHHDPALFRTMAFIVLFSEFQSTGIEPLALVHDKVKKLDVTIFKF